MWQTIKKIYKGVSFITTTFLLFFFMGYLLLTLIAKNTNDELDSMTYVAITGVMLSLPGIYDTLTPFKKKYKLSCHCPKCNYLIQMDMEEE